MRPSPNFGERKDAKQANSIILHYTGMKSGKSEEQRLGEKDSQM